MVAQETSGLSKFRILNGGEAQPAVSLCRVKELNRGRENLDLAAAFRKHEIPDESKHLRRLPKTHRL